MSNKSSTSTTWFGKHRWIQLKMPRFKDYQTWNLQLTKSSKIQWKNLTDSFNLLVAHPLLDDSTKQSPLQNAEWNMGFDGFCSHRPAKTKTADQRAARDHLLQMPRPCMHSGCVEFVFCFDTTFECIFRSSIWVGGLAILRAMTLEKRCFPLNYLKFPTQFKVTQVALLCCRESYFRTNIFS